MVRGIAMQSCLYKLSLSVAVSVLAVAMGGGVTGGALAADLPLKAPRYAPAWSWAGVYVGTQSSVYAGSTKFDDPFGPSIFGDRAVTPGYGWGGLIGYNWQAGNWVYGLEADANVLSSRGTATCAAFSGFYFSSNCRARPDAFGTVTARVGYTLGPEGRTLVYAKGGFAWQHNDASVTLNNNFFFAPQTVTTSLTQTGWTLGAGVERALTPAWSVKFEYNYMNFGHHDDVTIPLSAFGPIGNSFFGVSPATSRVSSDAHVFKVGVNYHVGQDPWSAPFGVSANSPMYAKAPPRAWAPGWEFEGGGRYWYSWGRFQKDLPGGSNDQSLISRLTYKNTANTGEFFARIDTPYNVFLKGNIGGGRINNGHMNDEDWGIFGAVAYSNTNSDPVKGPLFFFTTDVGYDFLRGPGYKVGAFVGFNQLKYTMDAGGCVQIANPLSDCVGAGAVPSSVVVITEHGTWNSFRVGTSAQAMLYDRWKLSGEVAYVPYTKFIGFDDHVLRSLVFDERGHGHGVQAEAFLTYMVTDAFSLGVGGRYWGLWTTSGTDAVRGAVAPRNDTYRTERAGITFQGSYKF
jgi:opacity protein-like surface antigen/outer membrane protease